MEKTPEILVQSKSDLSLEERTVAFVLTYEYPKPSRDTIQNSNPVVELFLDTSEDKDTYLDYTNRRLKPDSAKFIDFHNRNPFFYSNCWDAASKLLKRAIDEQNYDLKAAIISVISDPQGFGKPRQYYIDHDRGDGKQLSFLFYYLLGKKIGVGKEVEEEVAAYARAYKHQKRNCVLGRTPHISEIQDLVLEKEVEAYEKCLTVDFKELSVPGVLSFFPLLAGDDIIVEVLSSLKKEALKQYSKKYYKKSK